VRALESLPRRWLSVELEGYRPHEEEGTYSAFSYEDLPPVPSNLGDDLEWLLEAVKVPESLADVSDRRHPEATRPATVEQLDALTADTGLRLPASFREFVSSRDLQARVRSITYCYLDLGDRVVPAGDGTLVHFLADQQWVLHWLLYCDADGAECVVATDVPFGFELDDEPVPDFDPAGHQGAVCADSFTEFLYRFRIENEIWLALDDGRPLDGEEQAYVDHYTALRR
jgi:hypothetical protein